MPSADPDPITTLATVVATKAFSGLVADLTMKVLRGATQPLVRTYEAITTNFEPHLQATFVKCTKIKTLLNRDAPVDLLSQYVNLNFSSDHTRFDDYGVISAIRARRRVVISGTAGTGKTIFMKYLWLCLFENSEGRIPVFIELRRLNDLTTENLVSYIHRTMVNTNSNVSLEAFERGIAKGLFVFLFDGFDEILLERRDSIAQQISDLAGNNPECIVVISSRPDERFESWQTFSTFRVRPLDKEQVVELIGRINYDDKIKIKFLQRLKKDLYQKHQSFLASPLLATMMLMTFDQFADIPEKIHLFYEQAFDTLFAKHDALKEAFKRRMYTDLPIDVFKKYFALFCLVSYYEQKFEFTQAELLDVIDRALKIENISINRDAFQRDLLESVCILQRDGIHYTFSHRSFQEYFAAYCLARVPAKHVGPILEKAGMRAEDDMVNMLFDMNQDLVEAQFVIPQIDIFFQKVQASSKSNFVMNYMAIQDMAVTAMRDVPGKGKKKPVSYTIRGSSTDYNLVLIVKRLYPNFFRLQKARKSTFKSDQSVLQELFDDLEGRSAKRSKNEFLGIRIRVKMDKDGRFTYECHDRAAGTPPVLQFEWVGELGLRQLFEEELNTLREIRSDVLQRSARKSDRIDQVFNLN